MSAHAATRSLLLSLHVAAESPARLLTLVRGTSKCHRAAHKVMV